MANFGALDGVQGRELHFRSSSVNTVWIEKAGTENVL